MYAEQSESCIFAFEEPETNLHPSAQLEMYNSIKELSKSNQVIITTHSPYIVKKLAEDNIKPIVVTRDVENNVSSISQLDEQVLAHDDYVSIILRLKSQLLSIIRNCLHFCKEEKKLLTALMQCLNKNMIGFKLIIKVN